MANTWNLKGNLKGPKGDPGEAGPKGETGAAGKSVRVANVDVMSNSDVALSAIAPAAGIAVDDIILDNAGDLYTVTSVADDKVHVSNAIAGVSLKGPQGPAGEAGAKGDTGEAGPAGEQGPAGPAGAAFAIAKTYKSVKDMEADYAGTDVTVGQFVLIDTGNVDDEDNAKLYVKGATAYTYLTDLSGATGLTGPQGPQGVQGVKGDTGETGPAGPTGEKGDQGPAGPKGDTGEKGADGARGNTITTGTTAPTGDAQVGDVYVNATTGDFYAYGDDGAAA